MHTIETPFGKPGFLVLAGSRLFGIDTPESDYDYLGALIEPEQYRIGLKNHHQEGSKHAQHGFEQYMFKGDNYEGSVYSLWKLVSLFAEGNPTSLALMFANPIRDDYGICTDEFREMVVSRKSGHRFLKYMEAQRNSMTGDRASHTKRPELKSVYGYDTKFGGHLLRLGYQGCEFLETGKITLPMPDESPVAGCRLNVLDVRNGLWTMQEVVEESLALQARMEASLATTELPEDADWGRLSEWVVDKYQAHYLTLS
jgi:uncharacterized protein